MVAFVVCLLSSRATFNHLHHGPSDHWANTIGQPFCGLCAMQCSPHAHTHTHISQPLSSMLFKLNVSEWNGRFMEHCVLVSYLAIVVCCDCHYDYDACVPGHSLAWICNHHHQAVISSTERVCLSPCYCIENSGEKVYLFFTFKTIGPSCANNNLFLGECREQSWIWSILQNVPWSLIFSETRFKTTQNVKLHTKSFFLFGVLKL